MGGGVIRGRARSGVVSRNRRTTWPGDRARLCGKRTRNHHLVANPSPNEAQRDLLERRSAFRRGNDVLGGYASLPLSSAFQEPRCTGTGNPQRRTQSRLLRHSVAKLAGSSDSQVHGLHRSPSSPPRRWGSRSARFVPSSRSGGNGRCGWATPPPMGKVSPAAVSTG